MKAHYKTILKSGIIGVLFMLNIPSCPSGLARCRKGRLPCAPPEAGGSESSRQAAGPGAESGQMPSTGTVSTTFNQNVQRKLLFRQAKLQIPANFTTSHLLSPLFVFAACPDIRGGCTIWAHLKSFHKTSHIIESPHIL